jgi:hypothetical protein
MGTDDLAKSDVRVVSAVPGRIRLRATDAGGRRSLPDLAEELGACPEITSAQVRARSACILVRFDPAQASGVVDRLTALGIDVRPAAAPGAGNDPASAVTAAATAVNGAVGRRLEGTDLRVLVPLGLGLMAARRALRGEERLADAPWYVLAWYASEAFSKFNAGNKGK